METLFGLKETDLEKIIAILQEEPMVEEAVIFGSRAKGNFNNGSDVDIALKGINLDFETISHLSHLLNEETLMPYKFDLLNYNAIANKDLTEHINRAGISFYKNVNKSS